MIFPPSRPDPVDAVWCTWRGEPELLEARERYYTAEQMDDYATRVYAEGRKDEREEWTPVLAALRHARDVIASYPKSLGYEYTDLRGIDAAIARVTEG